MLGVGALLIIAGCGQGTDTTQGTGTAQGTDTTPAATPTEVDTDLLQAIDQQLVTISFSSTGGASGDIVNITLDRVAAAPDVDLKVSFPPGLMLANSDPSAQDLLLVNPSDMELAPLQNEATATGEAYCAQLHKDNPSDGTSMSLTGQAKAELVALAKAIRSDSPSSEDAQAAVWAITDNASSDDLSNVGYSADIGMVKQLLKDAGLDPSNYQLTA
jgi:hypothetical protein